MRASAERRTGAGVLVWLALAIIVALSVVGIYQKQFASQITLSVSRSMAGELALSLAHSAVEEAMHQVRMQANDPTSPLYYPLRRPVEKPSQGRLSLSRDLRAINLTETARMLERGPLRQFSYTEPVVEVIYQRPFDDLADERFGLIRYSTRATGAIGTSETVVRELQAYQEFRAVMLTTPRPFDELPFYVGRASALTDLKAANQHRRALLDLYRQSRDALKKAFDAVGPGTTKVHYQTMLSQTRDPDQLAASAQEVPEQPDAHVTGIWYSGQSYGLESMDLARRLQDAVPRAQRAWESQNQALSRVLASPGDGNANERMMATASETLSVIQTEMLRIWGFHFAFQFIPPGIPEYDSYESLARSRLGYRHWKQLAFFTLTEDPAAGPGRRIQAQFERLLKRAANPNTPEPPFNGVVLVDNQTEQLVLRGNLNGKMVVVVTRGGVRLENLNPDADMDDSLLVVCLGGTIEMSGTVNACIVATPYGDGPDAASPTIKMRADTVVKGALLVPLGATLSDWRGVLQYDDKYYCGYEATKKMGWPDHYYVGISPRTAFRSVTRK